jgi:hypothetical protein
MTRFLWGYPVSWLALAGCKLIVAIPILLVRFGFGLLHDFGGWGYFACSRLLKMIGYNEDPIFMRR